MYHVFTKCLRCPNMQLYRDCRVLLTNSRGRKTARMHGGSMINSFTPLAVCWLGLARRMYTGAFCMPTASRLAVSTCIWITVVGGAWWCQRSFTSLIVSWRQLVLVSLIALTERSRRTVGLPLDWTCKLAWQVTNSKGYASSSISRDQSRPFHFNSATTGSELTHESSRPAAESRDHLRRLPLRFQNICHKSPNIVQISVQANVSATLLVFSPHVRFSFNLAHQYKCA